VVKSQTKSQSIDKLRAQADQVQGMLPALLLEAEQVAASVLQGVHGRRRSGQGESFWQFRDYQPGDPLGWIDWRQSARSDRALVRETEWEASQTLSLWCDSSASMDFASDQKIPTKLWAAQVITLALSSLALRAQEQVGLLGDVIRPTSNKSVLGRMGQSLLDPPDSHSLANLPPILGLKRNSQAVWVSDFFESLDAVRKTMMIFANKGIKGALIEVHDPAEEDLNFAGRVRFSDSETGAQWTLSNVDDVRAAYQERMAHHRAILEMEVRAAGWSLISYRTDQPLNDVLTAAFLKLSSHHQGTGGRR
jgi:uncharacterized protein (DUF58 family)